MNIALNLAFMNENDVSLKKWIPPYVAGFALMATVI
jgi:hypothetical protein